jgi:hypothetical protein
MSTYGSRHDRHLDDDPNWERLMLKGVTERQLLGPAPHRKPHSGREPNPQPAQDFTNQRKAKPADKLLPVSIDWLKGIPGEVRPVALATRYARIVNLLARQWDDREACGAYFDDLLVDRRGNRRGFPAVVKSDISILHNYFLQSQHPPLAAPR